MVHLITERNTMLIWWIGRIPKTIDGFLIEDQRIICSLGKFNERTVCTTHCCYNMMCLFLRYWSLRVDSSAYYNSSSKQAWFLESLETGRTGEDNPDQYTPWMINQMRLLWSWKLSGSSSCCSFLLYGIGKANKGAGRTKAGLVVLRNNTNLSQT